MNPLEFTDDKRRMLRKEYNQKTNRILAEELGVSERTLVKYARSMGLVKLRPVRMRDIVSSLVCFMFPYNSYTEIAHVVGISKRTIARIVEEHGLVRTFEEVANIRSRIRNCLIRRERRHMLFGLPQATRLKLVTNKPRLTLKSKLRSFGYVEHPEANIFYYHEGMKRHPIRERNGETLGIRFYHLSDYFEYLLVGLCISGNNSH